MSGQLKIPEELFVCVAACLIFPYINTIKVFGLLTLLFLHLLSTNRKKKKAN